MTTDTPTALSAATVPKVALGHGLTPTAFVPGRYATAIHRALQGTHELQVLNEDSAASFILELSSNGSATAWRGWRYHFRNDGPEVHTEDHYREQQGYRGRFTIVEGTAEVVLSIDNSVCPHVFEGGLALSRAQSLKLRCVRATPSSASQLPAPVLLCQAIDSKPIELDPHVVSQILPSAWFALGSGNGLNIRLTGRPPGAQEGDELKATVAASSTALGVDAWAQP